LGSIRDVRRGEFFMESISLALVDDHPIIIEGLTHVLRSQGIFKVVATGGSSGEALAIAEKYQPELMILDLSIPGSAAATIAEISAKHPSVKILVFTAELGVEHAVSAVGAGAKGYVSKCCSLEELSRAAKIAVNGDIYVSPNFAGAVNSALRNASKTKIAIQAPTLNARENQIVRLLLDGKTNREIASDLGITERTVKHYMTVLMQKLNVRNRVEAVIATQNLARHKLGSSGTIGSNNRRYVADSRSMIHDAPSQGAYN
jgi:two-component system nitrate/nitrite response regulator NarL